MAPEIILEGAVDQRADEYALGCVAYFLLTGQVVFEAETPMKMFLQHLHTRPIPPSQRTELRIPREVDALVLACLEKDPAIARNGMKRRRAFGGGNTFPNSPVH